ncbi:MAG TPA: FHA domain-containing protein [Verrucomicrobiae bacterium]|jgi:pSer/pThr/pTyr-binding forkhead associated (FHA) protein|nr:FHA domain-containing protein [Verrucomicrobiae bacterium]
MARLLVKSEGLNVRLIDLKLGANRVGRHPDNDFSIDHATISSVHCEIVLRDDGVILRDLESTNGTFVNDQPVREIQLFPGQIVRLGDVELLVETTDAKIEIPKFYNPEIPAPPVVRKDGAWACSRHSHAPGTHQCTVCKEIMCEACVHRLRRKGGKKMLSLCPICSGAVELIGGPAKAKKKSLFERIVGETVKMKLSGIIRR